MSLNQDDPVSGTIATFGLASEQLGIRVISPYEVKLSNECLHFLAFIPNFGGPRGMLVAATTNSRLVEYAREQKLFLSGINPLAWVKFEKDVIINVLRDWGYFGPESLRPAWL